LDGVKGDSQRTPHPLDVASSRKRSNRQKPKHRKFHPNKRKNFLTFRVTALRQVAQRGCGVSFSGDVQNLPGQGPVQLALGEPALAGGLD